MDAYSFATGKLFIYALCEPNAEFAARYVGVTRDPINRLRCHATKPHTQAVGDWMKSVSNSPKVVIVQEVVGYTEGYRAEGWWIRHLAAQGHDLLNQHNLNDYWEERRLKNEATRIKHDLRREFNRAIRGYVPPPPYAGRPYQSVFTCNGRTLTAVEWAKELGVSKQRIYQLLSKNPPEIALLPAAERAPILWKQYTERLAAKRSERKEQRRQERVAKEQAGLKAPKSRDVRLSHRHRKLRREMMALVFAGDEKAVAEQFCVTTATVKAALRQFSAA